MLPTFKNVMLKGAIKPGFVFPADSAGYEAFEEEFPFVETEDQLDAIASIKKDMMSPKADGSAHLRRCGIWKNGSCHASSFQSCR